MVLRQRLTALGIAAASLSGGAALADTETANLNIQAVVVNACSVTDAALNFGTIDPAAGTITPGTTNINVTCNLGTSFAVGLDDGANVSSGARRLRRGSSTEYLDYELYKDVSISGRFGDAVTSERVSALTGLGIAPNVIAVYGHIPSGQAASAGTYSDTVQITVYY